jgi:hypothetical protein
MFAHESRCAEQARLLTVSKEYDYIVHKGASGLQGANGLENGGYPSTIIRGPRSGFDAVVMSHKKDRWATLPAGHSRENVLHSSHVGRACANARGILDLRLEAQVIELRDQVLADLIVLCTSNRMRPLRDGKQMLHRALCRKHSGWSTLSNHAGWTTRSLGKYDATCDKQNRNRHSLNRATFHREVVRSRKIAGRLGIGIRD